LKIGIENFTHRIYTKTLNWNFIGISSYLCPQHLAVLVRFPGLLADQGILLICGRQRRRAARGRMIQTKEESIESLVVSATK
jgi:hypothetical protein